MPSIMCKYDSYDIIAFKLCTSKLLIKSSMRSGIGQFVDLFQESMKLFLQFDPIATW